MTLEEYIEEKNKRVANMTLVQARDLIANTLSHSDMEIEFDKAVWMLLECVDEAIQNKVPEKVQQAYEDGKKDGYVSAKVEEIRNSEWIPVTERLPKDSIDVLISTSYGIVETAWYAHPDDYSINKGEWRDTYADEDEILAWMPLPKKYKGEQKE